MTAENVLRETLELLRLSSERSLAMAKARLALAIQYNPQTIIHWSAGRRAIGPRAERQLVALRDQLRKERGGFGARNGEDDGDTYAACRAQPARINNAD
jgi:hypothetical protein